MADNFRVSSDGLTYLFRIKEDALERRRAPHRRRLRIRLDADARAGHVHFPDGGRRGGRGARRSDARGALREPRSYFPYVLCSAWAFPWPPPLRVARRRLGQAGEPRGQRAVRARRVRRGTRPPAGEPALDRRPRECERDHFSFYPKDSRMVEEWKQDLRPPARLRPGSGGRSADAQRPRSGARRPVPRLLRRPGAVLERLVRKAFCHAVDREFLVSQYHGPASTGRPERGRSRRRCLRTPIESGGTTSRRLGPCSTRPAIRRGLPS